MLLRKQTIWLMTMLSLIAVLSVYYLTTPKANLSSSILNQTSEEEKTVSTEEVTDADPVFAEMRLQLNDNRSKAKEELQSVVATTNISEEERSKAYTKMQNLTNISSTEDLLETLIKSQGYTDALVRIEENSVRVTVKAKKNSPQAANEIIKMVTKELGHYEPISVEFQPETK